MKRRDFLKTAAATAVISSFADQLTYAAEGSIPYRTLGHTGEKVSLVGIGGYHLGVPSEEEAIRLCAPRSTRALISSITAGITTMATAKSVWGRLYAMGTEKKPS